MIWIIGGTKDSQDILKRVLETKKDNVVVSTATEYGAKLLEKIIKDDRYKNRINVSSKRLDEKDMESLIKENNINLVIDASHPYSKNVSKSVINVSNKIKVKYIRFEREMLDYGNENVEKFSTIEELKGYLLKLENKNILSTLGSNNLADIKEIGEKNNLYIRILPTTEAIKKAEELGYLPQKIIAIQGPVDKILNKAMLESYKIDYLITKESGQVGGELEKVEACREYGTKIIVLKRPFVDYGVVYNRIEDLILNI